MSAVIAYDDVCQYGSLDGAFGSSEVSSGTPHGNLANLLGHQLSPKAGFGDGGGFMTVLNSFAGPSPIQIIALLGIDFASASTLSVAAYADTHPDWSGWSPNLVDSLFFGYPDAGFVQHLFVILPEPVLAEAVRIEVGCGGRFLAGRLWASPLWVPPEGIEMRWRSTTHDPGEMNRSRGGQGYSRRRQVLRGIDMTLNAVPYEWTYGLPDNSILDLQQLGYRVGTTEPVIIMPRTRLPNGQVDEHSIHRLGVYGSLTEQLTIDHIDGDQYQARIRALELL